MEFKYSPAEIQNEDKSASSVNKEVFIWSYKDRMTN